jgi:hypothetical protein
MSTLKFRQTANRQLNVRHGFASTSLMLLATSGILILAGCGGMVNSAGTNPEQGVSIKGNVHGGQQPIAGATIQLYEAKATGTTYASASKPLISKVVTTDSNGNFTITSDYTCDASPNDQVYITAVQGDSGAGNNANIVLMAALGPCGSLSSSTYILINEVTTVASAYALAGFATDYLHIGSDLTNYTGLEHAFATVNNLVDVSAGVALATTPAYKTLPTGATSATFNSVAPQAEVYFLANILATCVNTNGVGGTSSGCANLFSAAKPITSSAPTDTFQAILDIAQNPGNNVKTLYNLEASVPPPFTTSMNSQPNDWTLSLSYTGGGLGGSGSSRSESTDLAIDASGNIWVTNSFTGTITELNNLGAPLSPTTKQTPSVVFGGYTAPTLGIPVALAIDLTGNVWIADNGSNTITELNSGGSPVGNGYNYGTSSDYADGVAIDGLNNVWVVASASIDEFTAGVEGTPLTTDIDIPNGAIAIDGSNNVWVENDGTSSVTEFANNGSFLGNSGNSLPSPSVFPAIDSTGKFWAPQGTPGSGLEVYKANAANTAYYNTSTAGSLLNAVSVSTDGAGRMWTVGAGNGDGALTELTNTGTPISPLGTGYFNTNLTELVQPGGSEIDASGNLWIINDTVSASNVIEFVGVGAPTITPLAASLTKIGQKP